MCTCSVTSLTAVLLIYKVKRVTSSHLDVTAVWLMQNRAAHVMLFLIAHRKPCVILIRPSTLR